MRTWISFALFVVFVLLSQKVLASETVKWPVPWAVGMQLEYETENLETTTAPDVREEVRTVDITGITITQASVDGFLQQWISRDTRMDVIHGDQAEAAMVLAAARAFEGFPLQIELDLEGNYLRVRNIDAISALARTTLEPLAIAGVEAGIQDTLAASSDEQASAARARAAEYVGGMLDRLTSPAVLEAAMGQVIQTYNAFVGIELEAGQQYELEADLDSPLGDSKIPAVLRFHLYASEDDPDDVFVEWNRAIDPVKGMQATWELVEKIVGEEMAAKDRKTLPKQLSMVDEGFVLFDRRSGVIEMLENTRTTRLGDRLSVSRNRMRLAGGEHGHTWAAEPASVQTAAAP